MASVGACPPSTESVHTPEGRTRSRLTATLPGPKLGPDRLKIGPKPLGKPFPRCDTHSALQARGPRFEPGTAHRAQAPKRRPHGASRSAQVEGTGRHWTMMDFVRAVVGVSAPVWMS